MRRFGAPIALIALTALMFCQKRKLEFHEMPIGSDAALTSQDGKRENLSASYRPATLLFFGYTRCPDFCPMILHKLREALAGDAELAAKTRLLFVSVDAANDKPEDLANFLAPFPFARGYTGTAAEIADVERKFGAHSSRGETIAHSLYVYLLNQRGKVVYLLRHDDTTEKIRAAIRQAAES